MLFLIWGFTPGRQIVVRLRDVDSIEVEIVVQLGRGGRIGAFVEKRRRARSSRHLEAEGHFCKLLGDKSGRSHVRSGI